MKNIRYRCPLCGNGITLHVEPTRPPTCVNPKSHSTRRIEMVVNQPNKR